MIKDGLVGQMDKADGGKYLMYDISGRSPGVFKVFIFTICIIVPVLSLVAQRLKCLPAVRETWVRSLGQEDPLEKEMATHSQFSCLENPMGGEAWWATVHGVAKGRTRLSDFTSSFIGEKFNYNINNSIL